VGKVYTAILCNMPMYIMHMCSMHKGLLYYYRGYFMVMCNVSRGVQ
jgi:hypothetical protein